MRDYLGTDLRHRIGGGYENLFLAWKVGFYAIFITKLKLFQFSQDKMRIFLNSIQDFVLQNSMHSKNLKNKLFS